MENKDKRVLIMVIVFVIMFAVIGSTLAYFSWVTSEEQQTSVTFTAESDFSCSADGGGNITSSDVMLAPSTCTNGEYAIQREVKVMPTINSAGKTVYMDLWLDVNILETGLSESENFMYALTIDKNSCSTGIITSGTFNGMSTGGQVLLLERQEYTETSTDIYYLYIWLDAAETSSSTMDQDFDLSLGGSCTDNDTIPPNVPVLDDGMIPVTIDNSGNVKTVSKNDSSWYDYDAKEWANAVLVKESGTQTRSYYQENLGNNVTVNQNDILAYYVWIPRYKYKIWTTVRSSTGSEQSIEIKFESKASAITKGTAIDEYVTHPAFVFGEEKLAGIWVGKFETTQGTSSNVGTSNPTILPSIDAWVSQSYNTQFTKTLMFSGGIFSSGTVSFSGSTVYGLSPNTDSHMAKNSEWGAVAYLSHSEYGINGEIAINGYKSKMTGCGSDSSTCSNKYGSGATSYSQSTTGNISGIFDISGGVGEYVMGNYNRTISDSEFTVLPPDKYYDLYTAMDYYLTACNGGVCYGHALSETNNWYGDNTENIRSSYVWLGRGGPYTATTRAGAFYYSSSEGGANDNWGFRSVLVVR